MAEKHNEITLEKRNQSKVVRSFALPRRVTQQPEKSQKFMIIANGIFYNGTEAEKVYLGNDLVWEKSSTPKPAHQIMGKFTDDSTEEDWKCKINGNDIVLPVDPTTKEFGYDYEGEVTSLRAMFTAKEIETLNLSNFDTSQVTDMGSMFYECRALTTLDVSNFDTSQVTNMTGMFHGCRKFKSLDVSNFDTSNVTSMIDMFSSCSSLTTVLGPITGIGLNWYDFTNNIGLKDSPLTNASAMVFINGLATVSSAKSVTFKASTYDTLTPEQIAVATSKGWNVVRSA